MGATKHNRHALNMDMNHPDNTVSFSKKKGCYMSRLAAFVIFVLFICSVAATGLLVYYYLPEVKGTVEEFKSLLRVSPGKNDGAMKEMGIPDTTKKMMTEEPKRPILESSTTTYIEPEFDVVNLAGPIIVAEENPANGLLSEVNTEMKTEMKEDDQPKMKHEAAGEMSVSKMQEIPKWSRRLPRALQPLHYVVKLQPFVNGDFSIQGSVEIEISVTETTSNITLHIADIITKNETITLHRLDQVDEVGMPIVKHEFDPKREFYIAHLAQPLQKGGRYLLSMSFEGHLNDNMKGFYRSSYRDNDGSQKFLAATQFQASDARRAFPCFDEPGIKSTFDVFLAREQFMTAISNMPIVETMTMPNQDGWVWDRFNTTVPMSTYLIAFAVSDFASLNVTNENWMFRVWSRESALQQAEYALKIGPDMLSHFEKFFNIPFPLPKLDMIALPDFAPGAMENWGLVTFRETLMLYHPSTSSAFNKQLVAAVTGHELAHQWFGNLVTPQWWTDIWLNEGFASYVEYIGVDHVEPSFQIMEQFVLKRIHGIFQTDSLESSHPIRHDAENADMIAYDKGSSIIRMMNHFLTDATFTRGLNNYLRAFQYANAEQDDLWHYLTLAAHEDGILPPDLTVKTIMDTWTLQMGYPVIKVVRSPDGATATVSQERFLQVKRENSTDSHDYKWWVPLTVTGQDAPDFDTTRAKVWMKPSDADISMNGLPASDLWVIFNIKQTGFYRVNYDNNNWHLIINQLLRNHSDIGTINRAQINDDTINFAKAGHLPYSIPLSLYRYLEKEDEYVPLATALNNLSYLRRMFMSTPAYGALKNYLLSIILPLYESVGFEDSPNDPHLSQYKRQKALGWACVLGYDNCLKTSVGLYRQWMENPKNNSIVSPNLKSMVYCRAIQEGGEEEWNFAWQQYTKSNVGSEKEQLLSAMGCTKQQWILSRYLEMAFTAGSGIRKQDTRRVFSSVASNPVGTSFAWNFLRENWNRIHDYLDKTEISLIRAATSNFNTLHQLKELQRLTEDHSDHFSELHLEIQQLKENVENNLSWMNNYYDVIKQWFQENGYASADIISR